jgi:uncharacterized protein YeaO (DUF488 family)
LPSISLRALRRRPRELRLGCSVMTTYAVKTKRIYENPEPKDGFRILVDRLWPRGLTKEKAKVDLWLQELAPSDELRKWFGHDTRQWEEFRKMYRDELKSKPDLLQSLMDVIEKKKEVTLLFAASDEEHNNAVVLKELIKARFGGNILNNFGENLL